MDDKKLTSLIKKGEESLKIFADDNFFQSNSYLLNKYSEEEIIDIFKFCLIQPSGKSWAPITQILLLLFQASFSKNIKSEPHRFIKMGNYFIHKFPKKYKPIIYSFGIGTDISFDLDASKKYKVPIFMYDPTPKVAKYMKKFSNEEYLNFKNEGIFSKEQKIKFYLPKNDKKVNSSIYKIHGDDAPFEIVQFRTLFNFMKINNHQRIDILKMDIEGAAFDVLEHMINNSQIRPLQIVTEIEVINIENPLTYLPKVIRLMKLMEINDYSIFNQQITRKASIELIFVNRKLLNKKLRNRNNILFKYFDFLKKDIICLLKKYIKLIKKDFKKNKFKK